MSLPLLVIGMFDPVTKGHETLFDQGLELSDHIGVYIGKSRGKRPVHLPYEVRKETVQRVIEKKEYDRRIYLVPEEHNLLEIDPKAFCGLLSGSDMVMNCYNLPAVKMFGFINLFEGLYIVEREAQPLDDPVKKRWEEKGKYAQLRERSSLTSKLVREEIGKGKDLETMVPTETLKILNANLHYFA